MKKVAILGSSGFVASPFSHGMVRSLEFAGANTGNFVFQHAVRQMLGDSAEVYNLASGEDSIWNGPGSLLDAVDLVVLPAANHLRLDADWTAANRWLETIRKPFVIMGLGAQADKSGDPDATAKALSTNASVVRMCELFAEKAVYVGVRGTFSQQVAKLMGISQADVTGCPSFMLSPRVDLGRRLDALLGRLRARPDGARFALMAEAPYNLFRSPDKLKLEQNLMSLTMRHRAIYIQQSGGEDALLAGMGLVPDANAERVRWQLEMMAPGMNVAELAAYLRDHGRVFFSAPDWIEYMKKFDLSLGHRFHGNMATIAAGRLGVVLTHDSRTSELVSLMGIPSIDAHVFDDGPPPLGKVLEGIRFDGKVLDTARARLARRWVDVFRPLGIPLEDAVQRLALQDGPCES